MDQQEQLKLLAKLLMEVYQCGENSGRHTMIAFIDNWLHDQEQKGKVPSIKTLREAYKQSHSQQPNPLSRTFPDVDLDMEGGLLIIINDLRSDTPLVGSIEEFMQFLKSKGH